MASTEFYVSPNGLSTAACTEIDPCDLQTGLNLPNMSGNILYMRGGIYKGGYSSSLDGAIVRSYPYEWAAIDSYYHTTLTTSMTITQTTLSVGDSFVFKSGTVLVLNNSEEVQVVSYLGNNTYTINRAWNGTVATTHSIGESVLLRENALTVWGNNSVFRDFEVYSSNPERTFSTASEGLSRHGNDGIMVFGDNLSFVNIVLHDNLDGLFLSELAENTEVYGLIVYNNGFVSPDRPHGHGMYIQNISPQFKTFTNNIVVNNYTLGIQAYGANQGHSNNLIFDGIISFNNGSQGYYPNNPTPYGTNRRWGNFELGSDVYPSTNDTIKNSSLYHLPTSIVELGGLNFGRVSGNSGGIVQNNYVAEPYTTIGTFNGWSFLQVTGNTFIINQPDAFTLLIAMKNRGTNVTVDNNMYYDLSAISNCSGGNRQAPFFLTGFQSGCGSFLDWNDWRSATGYDVSSTYTSNLPLQNKIIIQPNIYEMGRANIAVYNWENSSNITIDPSVFGLQIGDAFEVKNAENYMGAPVMRGQYNGQPIIIPLASMPVATPIGSSYTTPSTCPQFCAFVIQKGLRTTDANVEVSGQILTLSGIPIQSALIILTDPTTGEKYISRSNAFGHYEVIGVPVGIIYSVEVKHKNYTFATTLLNVVDTVINYNIIANEK